jgi:hypothetical protein
MGPWAGRARTRRRPQEGTGRGDGLSDRVGRLRLPRPAFYRMAGPVGKTYFLRQSQPWNGGTKAGSRSEPVVEIERMVAPAVGRAGPIAGFRGSRRNVGCWARRGMGAWERKFLQADGDRVATPTLPHAKASH